MNQFAFTTSVDRLGIYLNDHRALIVGELALTERCRSAHEGTTMAHHLTVHIGHTTTDRDIIDHVLDDLGHGTNHLKSIAAVVGERLGRLKPNGQLTGSSPLSPVVELEGLIAATHARSVMWNALDDHELLASLAIDATPAQRAEIAAQQLDTLRAQLDDAFANAFAQPEGSRP